MKVYLNKLPSSCLREIHSQRYNRHIGTVILLSLATAMSSPALANEPDEPLVRKETRTVVTNKESLPVETEVAIETTTADAEELSGKEWPYLGISTTEVSDALNAQLGLQNGVGLVVTYVAPDSPASKAGLQKHDVLVRLGEQSLVHPAQLRKLIRVHKPGEQIELYLYRAGKEQTTSVTLAKGSGKLRTWKELPAFDERIRIEQSPDDPGFDNSLHESLRHFNNDRRGLHREIHRRMEEVREVIKQAFRDVTNMASSVDPVRRVLKEINQSGVQVDKKAIVTVRKEGKGVNSVVKADDFGTIVLVQNPKIRLTAHDKEGHLLFDGEVETPEQRRQVALELWERVEPLLNQINEELPEREKSRNEIRKEF